MNKAELVVRVQKTLTPILKEYYADTTNLFIGSAPKTSAAFRRRCRAAAVETLVAVKLRRERERTGFVPMPLGTYVRGLAKMAGVSPEGWLKSLGITTLDRLKAKSASAVAQLARELGMTLRETLAHVRIGFSEEAGAPPLMLLAVRHRVSGTKTDPLTECEKALRDIESGNPKLAQRRRSYEASLHAAFAAER